MGIPKVCQYGSSMKKEDATDLVRDQKEFVWKQWEKERHWRSLVGQVRSAKKKRKQNLFHDEIFFPFFLNTLGYSEHNFHSKCPNEAILMAKER